MKPDDNNYVLKNFFHLEKKNNKKPTEWNVQSNTNVFRVQDGKNKWRNISVHYEINATKRVKQKCVCVSG